MTRNIYRSRRGMTLIEVMIAVVILVIMSTLVMQSLRNSIEFNTLLSERDGATRSARAALSVMRSDLTLAYLTPNRQAAEWYETVFVGLDEDPDVLFFASLAHERIHLDTRECDQTEITLWAEDAPKERGRGYILYHREAQRIDGEPDRGGVIYPLAYNVRSLNFRYLDSVSNDWSDEWDTRSGDTPYRLPRAIQIALVLMSPDPDDPDQMIDVPFLTTVIAKYAPPILGKNNPLLGGAPAPAAGAFAGTPMGAAAGANPLASSVGLNYGTGGGMGGMGYSGLGAGAIGGTMGALPGAQPKAKPKSRGSSASRPPGTRPGGRRGGRR